MYPQDPKCARSFFVSLNAFVILLFQKTHYYTYVNLHLSRSRITWFSFMFALYAPSLEPIPLP